MIIANPIYDVVFKRLMEDDRIAKFFIGTLLNETIVDVQIKPQEFTYTDQLAGLAVYRMDFIATLKTDANQHKKVLIEIQKAKNVIDLMRFRNYLAEQYKKEDEIETTIGKKRIALPIVTIYILGFSLSEIGTSVLHVKRNYFDLITNQIIDTKSDFIEKLTHDSYVVQLPRIEIKYQTKLDKLLSIFEQNNFVDDRKITKEYDHIVDLEGVKNMTDILHYVGTNPEERKQIEDEQEAWRTINAMTDELHSELLLSKQIIDENRKVLEEKDKLIEELKRKLEEK